MSGTAREIFAAATLGGAKALRRDDIDRGALTRLRDECYTAYA